MKKSALTLFLTLTMALALSACGLRPSGESDPSSGNREYDWQQDSGKDSSQNKLQNSSSEDSTEESSEDSTEDSAGIPSSEDASAGQPSSADTALADWYNSSDRTALENLINGMYNDSGLSFFVTIQEPDIIIYNYKYISQLDLSGMSQADIDAYYTNGLDDGAEDILSDIGNFQTTYGIPLTTIRMNYLNADDSLIFTTDFTEDYVSPASGGSSSSASSGTYDSLEDWLASDEARLIIQSSNNSLASSGMTIDLTADGNVFVYEYYISDDLGVSALSQEQIAAALDPVVESQRASLTSLFDSFESQYGIRLDGIRVVFYTEGGDRLYSADIANE